MVKTYVTNEIRGALRTEQTQKDRFKGQVMAKLDAVQVLILINTQEELEDLKKSIRFLVDRVDMVPPPPMLSLASLLVDVNSLVPDLCNPS